MYFASIPKYEPTKKGKREKAPQEDKKYNGEDMTPDMMAIFGIVEDDESED